MRDVYGYEKPPVTDTGFVDEPPTQDEAAEVHAILSKHGDAWVTYRGDGELRLPESYSNHLTPEAVYGLDAARTALQAQAFHMQASAQRRMDNPFYFMGYTRRPVGVVFRPTGKVLRSDGYETYQEDIDALMRHLDGRHRSARKEIASGFADRESWSPGIRFKGIMYATEIATDRIVGSVMIGDTYKCHPDKPRVWRELIASMGFSAVEDRHGFLTGDCGPQIALLDPAQAEVLEVFDNPCSATFGAVLSVGLSDAVSSRTMR